MTESLNGLRFDIYERVHLPDDVAAIEELEEIELIPHMQAIPLEDQVLLKGHLLLTGTYRSQEERSVARQLEHWIPVEISLPPSRVEKLEDLAIEIDNFDVDLLSSRSLNVTGVLGLKGLQVAPPPAPVWREDGFTVVHQLPPDAIGGEAEEAIQDEAQAWQQSPSALSQQESFPGENAAYPQWDIFRKEETAPSNEEIPIEENENPAPEQVAAEENENENVGAEQKSDGYAADFAHFEVPDGDEESSMDAQPPNGMYQPPFREGYKHLPPSEEGWGDLSSGLGAAGRSPSQFQSQSQAQGQPQAARSEAENENKNEVEPEAENESKHVAENEAKSSPLPSQEAVSEEKPGMKIALGSKTSPESATSSSGVGLLSHFGVKGANHPEPATAATETGSYGSTEADLSGESTGDEVEWTRLFLSKEAGEPSFRKVKLCIVQREDTLDAIATRYNVQPRELQLYNRLNDPHLSEGQVLYIPS